MAHGNGYTAPNPGSLNSFEDVRWELVALQAVIAEMIKNQKLIQRDDGCLMDGAVKPHTVSRELLALMGKYEFLGAYTARPYQVGQLAEWDGKLYVAAEAHIGADVPDLAKFKLLGLAGCGGGNTGGNGTAVAPALPNTGGGGVVSVQVRMPETVRLNVVVENVRVERLEVGQVGLPQTDKPPSDTAGNGEAGSGTGDTGGGTSSEEPPKTVWIDPVGLSAFSVGGEPLTTYLQNLHTPEGRAVNVRLDGQAPAPEGWSAVCSPPLTDNGFRDGIYYALRLAMENEQAPVGGGERTIVRQVNVRTLREAIEEAHKFFRPDAKSHDSLKRNPLDILEETWGKGSWGGGFESSPFAVSYPENPSYRGAYWRADATVEYCNQKHDAVCDLPKPYAKWPENLPSEIIFTADGFKAACALHDPHLDGRYAQALRKLDLTGTDGIGLTVSMVGNGAGDGFWIDRPNWTRAVKVSADGVVRGYGERKEESDAG